jgi:uncharacterized protein YndB with AHSA1/START domain
MSTMTEAVRLQRTIPAPPERVYRAWLDPELLRQWMSPAGFDVTRAEVDERVGGRFRVSHSGESGFEAEVLELVPDERIVLLWRFVGRDGTYDPTHDSLLTVELREAPGGTELTLVHERLEAFRAAMPEIAANVETGWSQALDKLVSATS